MLIIFEDRDTRNWCHFVDDDIPKEPQIDYEGDVHGAHPDPLLDFDKDNILEWDGPKGQVAIAVTRGAEEHHAALVDPHTGWEMP